MDVSGLSRDPSVLESLYADPLTHGKATPRLAIEATRAIERVDRDAGRLSVPSLLLHGSADRLVECGGTREFASRAPCHIRTYHEYEGGYHELFNDTIQEKVLDDTIQWLAPRLISAPAETRA